MDENKNIENEELEDYIPEFIYPEKIIEETEYLLEKYSFFSNNNYSRISLFKILYKLSKKEFVISAIIFFIYNTLEVVSAVFLNLVTNLLRNFST
jgi:hypothetical protein